MAPAWISACLASAVLAWVQPPFLSPDAAEMALSGACLVRLPVDPAACTDLVPLRWPPAFPLAAGLLQLAGVASSLAAVVVGLAGATAAAAGLGALAARHLGVMAAWLLPLGLAFIPAWRYHAVSADNRWPALAGIAWALVLVQRTPAARQAALLVACLALALWSRPEAAAAVGLVLIWALARQGRAALPVAGAVAGAGVLLGVFRFAVAGAVGASGRSWELAAYGLLRDLPQERVIQLMGVSFGTSPVREALLAAELSPASASLNPLSWVAQALGGTMPWWLGGLAVVGTGLVVAQRHRGLLVSAAILGLPPVAIALLPPSRVVELPGVNLLGTVAAAGLMGAAALAWSARHARPAVAALGTGLGAAVVVAAGAAGSYHAVGDPPELSPAYAAASDWLQTHTDPDARVACAFTSTAMVRKAERSRVRLPTAWEVPEWLAAGSADYVVVGSHDLPAAAATMAELRRTGVATPLVQTEGPNHRVIIYALGPPTPP